MGNKSTKAPVEHRRIYVGDVPEIEDDERPSNNSSSIRLQTEPTIKEEDDAGTSDTLRDDGRREYPPRPTSVKSPEVKATTRRNSLQPTATKTKWKSKRTPQVFPTNEIKSSRYTIITFIPKNLFEQFRRIVNFYFLCMAIVQTVTDSPVSPVTSAAPLVFVILVTAAKQGYEDWLRHRADNAVNNRPVNIVVDGKLKAIKSKELKVGDIVRLEGEEQVPSDILVLGSSDEFLRCQITTANLDGETNLKMRYCPSALPPLKHAADFKNLHVVVECEQPNSDLYTFNGSLLIPANKMLHAHGSITSAFGQIKSNEQVPNNVLPVPKSPPSRKSTPGSPSPSGTKSPPTKAGNVAVDVTNSADPSPSDLSPVSSEIMTPSSNFFQIPITMDNMVLRGTKVKNTEYIYGLIIYTGQDTRLAQNSKKTYTKFSTVEKSVNKFLMIFITVLFVIVCVCTGIHFVWLNSDGITEAWYLPPPDPVNANYIFQVFAAFLILFNYIIPISLYVTIEMQKFIGSKFFVWDKDLECPITGNAPLCNTSDLNEELGQIEYLFSDKTGTLTENVMEFRFCSINGVRYDLTSNNLYLRDDEKNINDKVDPQAIPDVKKFLKTLALCHTVQLMPVRRPSFEASNPVLGKSKLSKKVKVANSLFTLANETPNPVIMGKWEYQASSPDEKALLEACYRMGVVYMGEMNDTLTVEVFGEQEYYKRHFILEFDPDRKCMSVIVEDSNGEFWLYTKGAESTILPRADTGPGPQTMKHVMDFALMGMRTLAVAEKKLSKAEFDKFSEVIKKSRRLLKNREQKMREVYRSVESHLHVLGATGVEDQLQAGVPETLTALGAAGIRIWVLTGDKLETAVNVAVSCGLITPASKQILVTNYKEHDSIQQRLEEIRSEMTPEDNSTFVIDGESLQLAFVNCPDVLKDVAMKATRVVCCRMSPLQKAKVVSMVKQTKTRPVTAAVGDGANDVAMILEAHIGLAILGKEGRQAARSADFAVAKFSMLAKTILVHGHWYYVRLAILGVYFFYKNIVFILPQVYYCFHSAFSTQSLFDAYYLTLFNIFFASCPIFIFGLQEQTYPAEVLMANPHLYREISRNRLLTWGQFIQWNLLAFWHSAVVYFIPYIAWSVLYPITDWASFGTAVMCAVVGITNMKILLETRFLSWLSAFSYLCSFVSFLVFTIIYTEVDLRSLVDSKELRHSYLNLMSEAGFWLIMFIVTLMCLFPDYCIKAFRNSWRTYSRRRKAGPREKVKLKKLRTKTKSFRLPQLSVLFSKRSGKLGISSTTLTSYLSKEEI